MNNLEDSNTLYNSEYANSLSVSDYITAVRGMRVQFVNTIVHFSQRKDHWALLEWVVIGEVQETFLDYCICGHPIHKIEYIINVINKTILKCGIDCIEKIKNPDKQVEEIAYTSLLAFKTNQKNKKKVVVQADKIKELKSENKKLQKTNKDSNDYIKTLEKENTELTKEIIKLKKELESSTKVVIKTQNIFVPEPTEEEKIEASKFFDVNTISIPSSYKTNKKLISF